MINLENIEGFISQVESTLLICAAETTLEHQTISSGTEMSIVITDNKKIQKLNQQFRDIDAPTDVLSFPADYTDPENQIQYLGDVIISYPRAVEQASIRGNQIEDELQLLVVHGVLHLLGHDHTELEEKNRMWKAQEDILSSLGVKNIND